jgi:hypothetical protein
MANKKISKEAKPPKSRRTARRKTRQPKPAANLPEPINVAAARVEKRQPEKSGLLSDLSSLFDPDSLGSQSQSEADSSISSKATSSDPLPAESERLLTHVPDKIGGEADDPGGPADCPGNNLPVDDPIVALMAQVAFETQDVQDVIAEFFDWMAERFESDHWKLTDRQARMLGKPATQLMNSMWLRLQNYLPEILSRWCEETPGATAFILACGIVIAPKVSQQVKISRERAKETARINTIGHNISDQLKSQAPQPIRAHDQRRTVDQVRPHLVQEGSIE